MRYAATAKHGECSGIDGQISTIPCYRSMDAADNIVFVDLETTGGNVVHHRITEIGIVRVRDNAVIEEWSTLVNPDCEIPAYIQDFTGISNEMVADAPR